MYTLEERQNMRALAAEMRQAARIAQLSGLLTKATDLMIAAVDLEDGADEPTIYTVPVHQVVSSGSVDEYLVPVDPADATNCEACS